MKRIEGILNAEGLKFALVAGRFNKPTTDKLVEGAKDCLIRHGAREDDISLYLVPGSFEIPPMTARVAARPGFDAVIALGTLIRGDTPHFDLLAGEVTRSLADISLAAKIPIIFGILTTDTIEQAMERAGTKSGNKGWDAALAAIEMIDLYGKIGKK
ncbi:MAG: 6,7-dimethyl-8-ribityllumazine synthase [Candidatus Glassbacteria bacterium RBG_16_58_8]|uniref:6,7-dimethyl-8-ribityllumazine synthase n=1 Tax=Candidatus Glassbacteria bacterium RBG_16_58_8 TaxID=1817866 RepID=A0A1F5YCQ0_9BACT|nr:MAG: 6,7-dimethyl-8-ribityllumazine synthase [Candidatus Glassbacteria bacterium RBG_16_58_8]